MAIYVVSVNVVIEDPTEYSSEPHVYLVEQDDGQEAVSTVEDMLIRKGAKYSRVTATYICEHIDSPIRLS